MALFAMTQIIGFASGMSMANWAMYGDSIEEAVTNARWVRRLIIAMVAYAIYLGFFRKLESRWVTYWIGIFLCAEILNLCFEVALGSSLVEAFSWSLSTGHLLVGGAALSTSLLLSRSNKTMEPTR
jgi:hypothetical protein